LRRYELYKEENIMKKTALKKNLALGKESLRLLTDPGLAVGGFSAWIDTACNDSRNTVSREVDMPALL